MFGDRTHRMRFVATHDGGIARDVANMIAASSRVGSLTVVIGEVDKGFPQSWIKHQNTCARRNITCAVTACPQNFCPAALSALHSEPRM